MKIPFIDLKLRFEEEKAELLSAVEKVLRNGSLVLTPELSEFEEQVAQYVGVKHCIGLNSGTDGIMMGLWASGIGKDDEVIHPPISFVATTGAIHHVGATPVYAEVGQDSLIDPDRIEEKITSKTKAIMPVHWAGMMCDMDRINKVAEKHGLMVIEDSAQAMGSYYKGQHGGTIGQSGCISCHPLKVLNAIGDGGLLLTNDDNIAEKVRLYRNHGTKSRDNVVMYGVNSRLDVVHAEILKFRLSKLDSVIERRRHNANLYRQLIKTDKIKLPIEKTEEGYVDSYVMFIARADNRDKLKQYLSEKGIETLIYYGTALHLHEAAKVYGYKRGDFPIAEKICDEVIALPHHQNITEEQIKYVSGAINEFYR